MTLQGKSVSLMVAAAVAVALAGGCRVSTPPEVWVAGEMVRLTDQSTRAFDPIVYDGQTRTVKLQAAGGETVSFQVVIDAGPQAVSGLSLSWTELAIPLSSFGPAARARQWRVNFARFAAQGNEASSWVPVDRHFYQIDRLGALVLPSLDQTGGGAAASQP